MTDLLNQVTLRLRNAWVSLREREDGQTMVEYGLLLAGIAILVIAAVFVLGDDIRGLFEDTASSLDPLPGSPPPPPPSPAP
jgi:pilus assembly protein Flp/PilA